MYQKRRINKSPKQRQNPKAKSQQQKTKQKAQQKEVPPNPALNVKRTGRNRAFEEMPIFKAALRLEITGFNQVRILNAFNQESINIKNIKRISPKIMQLTLEKKDCQKTFAILKKMCYDYRVIAESGVHTLVSASMRHIGLIIGAVFFTIVFATLSQMVWKIEISGNEKLDSALISRNIRQCGIKVGTLKNKLDVDAASDALREMEGIAEGTVEIKGTTVFISVLEEKSYIPPSKEQEFSDIVSLFDAEITSITAKSGTCLVNVGERVQKGQILIRGERLNSNGELLEQVRATGSVYGKVAIKQTHIFSKTQQTIVRTGKKKTFTNLSLFGLSIGKKSTPKGWEQAITHKKLFLIPIKVTHTKAYQTKIEQTQRDVQAYAQQLKDEAILNSVIKAGGGEIETTTTLKELDGELIMLNIYIQAEVLLGQCE